jgi:hypothetical protein
MPLALVVRLNDFAASLPSRRSPVARTVTLPDAAVEIPLRTTAPPFVVVNRIGHREEVALVPELDANPGLGLRLAPHGDAVAIRVERHGLGVRVHSPG